MSSIIDPIITVRGDRKLAQASIAITAGTSNGSASVTGLETVNQVLAVRLIGTGTTVTGAGSLLVDPFIQGNVVGVSLVAAATGVTAKILVQGF